MRGETHAEDLEIDSDVASVDVNTLLARLHSAAVSAGHAVAWNNDGILGVGSPLLESLKREATVQHAGRGEEDHGFVGLDRLRLKLLDVLKVEHIVLDKGLADFLIRPIDKQLVVEVGLFGKPTREVDRVAKVGPRPISLQKNAELLGSAQREHGNEDFPTLIERFVDLLKELALSRPLTIANGRRIGGLGNNQVGLELVNPS